MKAKFVKHSICQCGFPVLDESVPLGTVYEVDPSDEQRLVFICGGCGKWLRVMSIWVNSRAGSCAGFLPKEIFELAK